MEKETEDGKTEEEISLLDYLIVLAKQKWFIVIFTVSVTLITAVYSLMLPEVFKAETKLLPPGKSNKTSLLMREIGGMIGINQNSGKISDPSSIVGILSSRTIYDRIIDKFDLMDIFEAIYMEDAREILSGYVQLNNDKFSGIITITVYNKDPKLAADLANGFVEELKNLMQTIAITEASQRRLFFEEELKKAKENLIASEDAMVEFQEKTGALRVEDQTKAVIKSMAEIRAQIATKEVELKVMKTYSTLNNPDFQMSLEALKGLKHELNKLEEKGDISPNPLLTTGMLPVVGTDYIRKLRDLKFNETLFELMAKQYEAARIDEANDPAIIQVLDKAIPPERRFKPHRRKMVTVSFITSLFLSVFLAFLIEYLARWQPNHIKFKELKRYLPFARKD